MKYSLAPYSQTISDTTEGDISLTTDEIITILNTTSAQVEIPTASGSVSGTLILDCDLGTRIHTDEIQYYFDAAVSGTEIIPYIKFYVKDENFDIYISLQTYYNGTYYYATISGTDAPRYVKVEHTVISGSSGQVNGFRVINDDTYVDFGEDGSRTSHNVNTAIDDPVDQIDEMEVYNSGSEKANAKLILEPQYDISDTVFSISNNSTGPWYGIYQDSDKITGEGIWESGTMDSNLQLVDQTLKLLPGQTAGIYTTRIIKLDEDQQLTFNRMNKDYPSAESIIATDDIDTLENIEVRSSNSEPMPRTTYIELTGSYGASTKYTQHSWMADGTVAETSSDWDIWGQSGNFWEVWYDSRSEDEYIVDKPYYTGGNTGIYQRIRKKNDTIYSINLVLRDYDDSINYSTFKWVGNSSGGSWIYFYLKPSSIDTTGYYRLRYYNTTLGTVYERTANDTQGTFLYDFDCLYNSTDMWYTDNVLSTVFKINTDGTIIASYLATDDIRGVLANDDGGCWFIQQSALIRISSNGIYMDAFELPTNQVSYVYSDFAGGFWLHDGYIVRHLDSSGNETFNVEVQNLYHITPTVDGVLTKHHDGSISTKPKAGFISKDHQTMTREWDYPVNEGAQKGSFDYNRYGARSHRYDDLESDHASNFPIAIDTQWNTFSEWEKVSLRDYNFTNDQYHQVRFTLRADDSSNSPEVYGLFTQRAIQITDIYPGNYGRFYLKSNITSLTPQDAGDYTSNVRAYWFIKAD